MYSKIFLSNNHIKSEIIYPLLLLDEYIGSNIVDFIRITLVRQLIDNFNPDWGLDCTFR